MKYYFDKSSEEKIEALLSREDRMIEEIFRTEKDMRGYLDFSPGKGMESVGNRLLARLQKPDAKLAKTYAAWKKLGFAVRRGEKGICLLRPAGGKTGTRAYRTWYVFDVSQLEIPAYRMEELLHQERMEVQAGEKSWEEMFTDLKQAAGAYKIRLLFSREETGAEEAAIYAEDNVIFLHPDLSAEERYRQAVRCLAMTLLAKEERWQMEELQMQADMVLYQMERYHGKAGGDFAFRKMEEVQKLGVAEKRQMLQDVSWICGVLQKQEKEKALAQSAAEKEDTEDTPPVPEEKKEVQVPEKEGMEIPALERQEKREKKAQVPEKAEKLKEKKTGQAKKAAIGDFGEKIGGARKDIWKERGLSVEDLALMNESEAAKYVTKENIWKKPDYRQMMADGIPPRIAFYVKEVRNALPVKAVFSHDDKTPGQIRKRQEDYIGLIRYFKENLLQIGTEDGIKAFFDRFMEEGIYIKREAFYLSRTEAGFSITNKLLRAMQVYDFHTMDRKMEKEQFTKAPEEKVPAGYRLKESEGLWSVTDKSKGAVLQGGFETEKEALAWLKGHVRDTGRIKKKKYVPPQLENLKRTGPDTGISEAAPADGERFLAEFGFRGGEFGNWMTEKDRQASLDLGYEALYDLAEALEIPKEDISLGNRLAIAFGSRGRGNAAAHYEPDREVINLTKMRGAGSLAHEWGHALDDIMGKMLGLGGLMTGQGQSRLLPESMKKLLQAMHYRPAAEEEKEALLKGNGKACRTFGGELYVETDYYRNAVKADGCYSKEDKGYWHSSAEMFARAFACYIKDRLGWRSDYLCGHAESPGCRDEGTGEMLPLYPAGEERKQINAAMDAFIAECKRLGILADKNREMTACRTRKTAR